MLYSRKTIYLFGWNVECPIKIVRDILDVGKFLAQTPLPNSDTSATLSVTGHCHTGTHSPKKLQAFISLHNNYVLLIIQCACGAGHTHCKV